MTSNTKRKSKDYIPVTVPFSAASPTGDLDGKSAVAISDWANRSVWTDRMLNALAVGVRGGKWHALIDKAVSELNLYVAARKVLGKKGAAGIDRQSTADFAEHEVSEIRKLHRQLSERTYRPRPVQRKWIPKPGSDQKRPLGIPKDRLMDLIHQKISDRGMLALIESFLNQSIMDELKEWTPETGVPQGAVLSPVLANLYLNELDHRMAALGYEMVRYADDFVILCRSQEQAETALEEVKRFVNEASLTLHPEKTHIVDSREKSFSFLGYSFRGRLRFPRAKSHAKMVSTIRKLTPRKSGQSMKATIAEINSVTSGWFTFFRHCTWNVFDKYDGMIRRRLRRQLLKRHRTNPKRLPRTHRWPNAYFAVRGLRSLRRSHTEYVQSLNLGNN